MKIEICEQMVQSWLQHYKQCEIVQTNWKISPLRLRGISDADIAELERFMKEFQKQLNQILEDETKESLNDEIENSEGNLKKIADIFSDWHVTEEDRILIPIFQELQTEEQRNICIIADFLGYKNWIVRK